MKRVVLLCLSCSLLNAVLPAQIPNGSFEQFYRCPTDNGQFTAVDWFSPAPGSTPDLYSTCSGDMDDVTTFLEQTALEAAYGDAFAGIVLLLDGSPYREYISCILPESLKKDRLYKVSVDVALPAFAKYIPDDFQLLFTSARPSSRSNGIFAATPSLKISTSSVMAGEGWIRVEGVYRASGGERFMTVGNFAAAEDSPFRTNPQGDNRTRMAYLCFDGFVMEELPESGLPLTGLTAEVMPVADEPEATVPAGGKVMIVRDIHFHTDSWVITDTSVADLDSLAVFLAENPGIHIVVSGHTDNTGLEEWNIELSLKRAGSTAEYLSRRGVPPENISTRGRGGSQPLAGNESEEGRALNRRVEIRVLPAVE